MFFKCVRIKSGPLFPVPQIKLSKSSSTLFRGFYSVFNLWTLLFKVMFFSVVTAADLLKHLLSVVKGKLEIATGCTKEKREWSKVLPSQEFIPGG